LQVQALFLLGSPDKTTSIVCLGNELNFLIYS